MDSQIQSLIDSSRQIIKSCSLSNGAIIGADSSNKNYPKQAKNYRYVWPRDAAYACIAANRLGIRIQERFFDWCMNAEGWKKTGLFYKNYTIDGKKHEKDFQPDQTGMVLFAIHDYYKDKVIKEPHSELLVKSADALCGLWDGENFNTVCQDIWEERFSFPDLQENFTYSLAACCKGLMCANELIPKELWSETAAQMKGVLLGNSSKRFCRSFGRLSDERIDASLLGLVRPFEIVDAKDKRMRETVKMIEKLLEKDKGIRRYENDEYDGWMYKGMHRKKGAGYWPLLNFWLSIYYSKRGKKRKGKQYLKKVVLDLKGSSQIPEQIFSNDVQVGVSPLLWSHSMFVLACDSLGWL